MVKTEHLRERRRGFWSSPDPVWVAHVPPGLLIADSGSRRDGQEGPQPSPPTPPDKLNAGTRPDFGPFPSKKKKKRWGELEHCGRSCAPCKMPVNKRREESARARTCAPHGNTPTLKKQLIPDSVKHERQREAVNIKRRRSRGAAFLACL